MHDALLVGESERAGNLVRQRKRLPDRQRPFALDQLLERFAANVLEHDVLEPVEVPAVDDGDDVGVRHTSDRPRLAAEALHELRVAGEVLVQDLERHRTLQQPVVRAVDARHPTAAEKLLDFVTIGDDAADQRTSSSASSQTARASSSSASEITSGTRTRMQFP